ncbi:MAG: hypothetical protein R6V10_15470 [bacterium]
MKTSNLLVLVIAAVFFFGCGDKKEEEAVKKKPEFQLKKCPLSRIEVTPEKVYDKCVLNQDCKVELAAAAYDHDGNQVDADLTWSVRYPDGEDEKVTGRGHRVVVHENRRAVFIGSGNACGIFTVRVEDRTCNLATEENPQYVLGQSWIKVVPPPDADIVCGPMRLTYGDRLDRMGDTILASAKGLLLAEVCTNVDLNRMDHRVQFYINGEPYVTTRPLYEDPQVKLRHGKSQAYFSYLPMYLAPGKFSVYYEFLKEGEVVCGSRTERFKAR